jgi:hypothetical protein
LVAARQPGQLRMAFADYAVSTPGDPGLTQLTGFDAVL